MNLKTKEAARYVRIPSNQSAPPASLVGDGFNVLDRNRCDNVAYCDTSEDADEIVQALNYLKGGTGPVEKK